MYSILLEFNLTDVLIDVNCFDILKKIVQMSKGRKGMMEGIRNKFFKNILQKTKGLLIDDFDDRDYK